MKRKFNNIDNRKPESIKFENKLMTFSLDNQEYIPRFVEKSNKDWVAYGANNLYPNFLIELANSSALHGAISISISDQIKGQGIRIKDGVEDSKLQAYIDACNLQGESLHEVVSKLSKDYTLFGGFAINNIWNKAKTGMELYHTDFSTLRSGKLNQDGKVDTYYFSSDWSKVSFSTDGKNIKQFESFNPDGETGSQVFYYKPYSPGNVYYPIPEYVGAISWANLDYLVSSFHTANLENGFFPSLFINMNNGIPDPERADEIYSDLMQQFKGESKAGKIILNYSNGKETAPEVTVLNNNDNDTKFTDLANLILQQLLSGWRVTSPELVGIKTPGQLGNQNIVEQQELFYNLVIKPKQDVIENKINYLLKVQGFQNEIEIIPSQPVSFSVSESTMVKVLTVNEIREMIGKEPIDNGDNLPDGGQPADNSNNNIIS